MASADDAAAVEKYVAGRDISVDVSKFWNMLFDPIDCASVRSEIVLRTRRSRSMLNGSEALVLNVSYEDEVQSLADPLLWEVSSPGSLKTASTSAESLNELSSELVSVVALLFLRES